MSTQFDVFVLVNLEGGDSFSFRLFPEFIETSRRSNWRPQDTTIGTQPLFYGNREPRRVVVDELWLDNTDIGESLTQEIERLFTLQDETPEKGRPPALLSVWGDRQERVVLEEVRVIEQRFNEDGTPIRARVSLTLIEVQEEPPPPRPVRVNAESSFTF
ncbi:MAG: hypothetical protein ACRD9R_03985 [Pyrinomonadaceae bacterium]